MKVQIICTKCGSNKVSIISEKGNPTPMYKCNKCGYKHNLFPQFENKESIEEIEKEMEDEQGGETDED